MSTTFALLPKPAGACFPEGSLTLDETLSIACWDTEFCQEAELLAERLRAATGFAVPLVCEVAAEGTIVLVREDWEAPEAYQLAIDARGAVLHSGTAAGIFRGIQTLLQLLPAAVFSRGPRPDMTWSLPFAHITDFPRFSWRGAMLDASRHFAPVEFVYRFLDAMALHKLNVFHWHLTDDQGWRIEIKKYPRLTEIGSQRRETICGHVSLEKQGDGVPHGGFYTQEQIRDIVAYAAARHIQIVPEIDMPGHMVAAISAYPALGCTNELVEVATKWGVFEQILHPGSEAIAFCIDVLREVLALFPSPYVHLGGDEAVKTLWQNSPDVQEMIRAAGVADEAQMQGYFMSRVNDFLLANGRRMIGWDEILEGGAPRRAVVMSWRGQAGGVIAAQSGNEVVMAPENFTYLDHYQSPDTAEEPLAIGGLLPLEKCYSYDPLPESLTEEDVRRVSGHGDTPSIQAGPVPWTEAQKACVLGVQGQLWREYMPDSAQVEYMAFPRLCAIAEIGWSRPEKDYPDFLARLRPHLRRLNVLGLRYRPLDA
jgi:hexosaminidase